MFWLGAAVTLCYVPGVTGAYIASQWPLLAVLMTLGLLRSGPFTWLHLAGLLFVAYAAVRLPFSPVPYWSVFGLWVIVILAMCVWFGSTLGDVKELYKGLATGAAVSSVIAVLHYAGFQFLPAVSGSYPGLYVNSVQQGATLALLIVALASERLWLWALPLLPGLYLAHSRGAWLMLVVGLLACCTRRLWVFGAVGVAGATYFAISGLPSDAERLFIWQSAWDNMRLFGWGPGVFYNVLLTDSRQIPFFPEYAHNDALQLMFEYGVGAVLPFAVFGFALSRTKAAEWPVILAFVAASCYSMPLFMPIVAFLALVAVGRVLRTDGVVVGVRSHRRQHGVPRRRSYFSTSGKSFSVPPHHTAKG